MRKGIIVCIGSYLESRIWPLIELSRRHLGVNMAVLGRTFLTRSFPMTTSFPERLLKRNGITRHCSTLRYLGDRASRLNSKRCEIDISDRSHFLYRTMPMDRISEATIIRSKVPRNTYAKTELAEELTAAENLRAQRCRSLRHLA